MNTKDLATARKNASTDATPQLLSWAEETIADMPKLLQQQAVNSATTMRSSACAPQTSGFVKH
jgi:hypothetical protein